MIDFIKGIVASVHTQMQTVTVETGGLGYQVHVPAHMSLEEGETVHLYTHFVVREDSQSLYGFSTMDERDCFRLLLEVSGIGPKAGMAMLSSGSPRDVVTAIQLENIKFLTKMPGIGKKTAQRIVLDLKDKLKKWGWDRRWTQPASVAHQPQPSPIAPKEQEAIEALMALGYNEVEARKSVDHVMQLADHESMTTEDFIKLALKAMMKR